MYVKNYMTKALVTVTKDVKVLEALDLMKAHDIHRLPVVEEQRLIGLITEELIAKNTPSRATSLSMHELNYLLTKTEVGDIMQKNVLTCNAGMLLEQAALKMRQQNINVLPVVKDEDHLIGIITDKDIFDAFIDILGYKMPGVRMAIQVRHDSTGVIEQLGKLYADNQYSISQIVVYRKRAPHILIIVHIDSEDEVNIRRITETAGFEVVDSTIKK